MLGENAGQTITPIINPSSYSSVHSVPSCFSWTHLLVSPPPPHVLATPDTFVCSWNSPFKFISFSRCLHLLFPLPRNLSPGFAPLHSVPDWRTGGGVFPAQSVHVAPQGHTLSCSANATHLHLELSCVFICVPVYFLDFQLLPLGNRFCHRRPCKEQKFTIADFIMNHKEFGYASPLLDCLSLILSVIGYGQGSRIVFAPNIWTYPFASEGHSRSSVPPSLLC